MPLGFSAPPCPPAWPSSRKGKTELIKRCFLGEKGGKPGFCFQGITYALKVFVLTLVPLAAEAFLLSSYSRFSFFRSHPKLFLSCCQATRSRSDGETLSLSVSVLPLCYRVFVSLQSQGLRDALCFSAAPQCILVVFLQLNLLPSYSPHLLAKPFGVLTKCLPRLLLRNVHMQMRVMNNASLYARGSVCERS